MMPVTAIIRSVPSWLELVALAACVGTLVCRLWVLPPAVRSGLPGHEHLIRRMRLLFAIGIAVVIAGSIADLLLRTAEMSGAPVRDIVPLLPAVVLRTHYGKLWLIRVAVLVIIAVLLRTAKRSRDSPAVLVLLFVSTAVIAMTESATGHAADAGDFTPAEFMDWFHLLGALAWGGGLLVLSLMPASAVAEPGDKAANALAEAAVRFSRIAGMSVGIILITSLYHAWAYVGSIEALEETDYGRVVAVKIGLFFLLLALATFNRYIGVPALMERAGIPEVRPGIIGRLAATAFPYLTSRGEGQGVAVRFTRIVRFEAVLMLGVLLCASLLRHDNPASHYLHREHAGAPAGQGAHLHQVGTGPEIALRIETAPPRIIAGVPVTITVHLEALNGRPVRGLLVHHDRLLHAVIIGRDLRSFAHIHPEDLGPVTDEMLKKGAFPLRFTFAKAGIYLVGLDFATGDGLHSKTSLLDVAGRPTMSAPAVDTSREKNFGAYHVKIVVSPKSIKADAETTIRLLITKQGEPVTDLEPYLGAPMHLAVVRSDLTKFIHAHGYSPGDIHLRAGHREAKPSERYGPEIDADIVFPAGGTYKIFCQVNHHGRILLFDFMVSVEREGREER
jgi:putative copper resistance protein D